MQTDPTTRFVILGFPRSGTTLLSRILDAHPQISSPPETGVFSAAGRFLTELTAIEGPPIGVQTGLAFAGIPTEDLHHDLRTMLFGQLDRIAGAKPVWVEKTATDLFHLERLEPLLAGHVRFICTVRNPLDVVPSNITLARTMAGQLTELFAATRGINSEHDAIAKAWVDRQTALDAFVTRHPDACFTMRYEDLLTDPDGTLGRLLAFAGLQGDPARMLADAFSGPPRIGLGDMSINDQPGLRPANPNGWRKRLPPAAAGRIVPVVAPLMLAHDYAVPKMPKPVDRDTAIRQYEIAARMKQQMAAAPKPQS
jgi:protein-tyrosine sulfotransferase